MQAFINHWARLHDKDRKGSHESLRPLRALTHTHMLTWLNKGAVSRFWALNALASMICNSTIVFIMNH
jgi:hypothetical protein